MPIVTYAEVTPEDWTDAKRIASYLSNHLFRGHADATWHLEPTIERVAKQYSVALDWLPRHEQVTLRRFKSRAHHYLQSPPAYNDNVEWLCLIREYGGPSRLLDMTDSFYIAAFFAVEDATQDACIWAINESRLTLELLEKNRNLLPTDGTSHYLDDFANEFAETFIIDETKKSDLVIRVTPLRLSERQAIQQGAFLMPLNLGASFESNLASTFGYNQDAFMHEGHKVDPKDYTQDWSLSIMTNVHKINLPRAWHKEIISDLFRMNIEATSLYPGLDGFARSLKFPFRLRENSKQSAGSIPESQEPSM